MLYDPDAGRAVGWGARLEEPLVEGETAYVYHRDGMQLGVSRGTPPDALTVADPIGGRRKLWYGHGPARYFPGVDVAP